jgi:hypothetical protein
MSEKHKKGSFITSNRIIALASILALLIAVRSCYISNQSLDVAQKSNEIANRPYLTLKPIKFRDTDNYLKITADYSKPSLSVEATFEMINLGKTPAKDVLCPQGAVMTFRFLEKPKGFIAFEIPIIYSSVINSSKKYSTMISYKIYKDDIEFVKSEIE